MKAHWLILPMLAGCAHVPSGSCSLIQIREYNEEFTAKFRLELNNVADGSAVGQFIVDSVALRDAVRACRGNS